MDRSDRSHQIASDRIRSHQIASDHIRSHQIASDHIRSHQITSDRIRSHQIASDRIRSRQIASDHIRSYQTTSDRVRSQVHDPAIFRAAVSVMYQIYDLHHLHDIILGRDYNTPMDSETASNGAYIHGQGGKKKKHPPRWGIYLTLSPVRNVPRDGQMRQIAPDRIISPVQGSCIRALPCI